MKTAATDHRFPNKSATPKTSGRLGKNDNSQVQVFLREELQGINVEGMREIENHHEANTIVIIVASKTHWRVLTLVGASLRRNQGMRNGVDLDWTDHRGVCQSISTRGRGGDDIPLSYIQQIHRKVPHLPGEGVSCFFLPLPNSGLFIWSTLLTQITSINEIYLMSLDAEL